MAHADTVMADALKDYVNSPNTPTSVIAKRHGVSPSTLTVWAKKAKVKLRGRGRESQRQPNARTRAILELAEALTLEEVGERYGMSKQRVSRIVRRWADWKKPRQAPFVVDDVIEWNGEVFKVIEAGPLLGKVLTESGQVILTFYWSMKGESAKRVDPSRWKPKKPHKAAA